MVAARARRLRILSPSDGDHYSIPAGVGARYATISLHAGGDGAEGVDWSVDGKDYAADRWPLVAGAHEIRAPSARGETATARIVVAP